jgi:tyrosyl-tRNA synthetase
MTLSEELQWRGFINQTTLDDLRDLDTKTWTAIGNFAAMMFDKVFMRHGHHAILLAGGATSLIGDPGGKDGERVLQDETVIGHNVACAEAQLRKVFTGFDFQLVNNLDWTKDMSVVEFLRDIGKHFSMTPLVQRDYIARRLGEGGSGISYAEFSYTILQGMDFLHLFDEYECVLQLGGADQWGNCLSGVDLIRRVRGKEAHVITLPLIINKATGKKFGKSEDGAVWLDSQKTSPYQFYQFWLNADDAGVEGYLKIFTELDKPAIERVISDFSANPASRIAQKTLAYEVTKLIHGQDKTEAVRKATDALFGRLVFSDLSEADRGILKAELSTITVLPSETFPDVLVRTGLATSRSDAIRFVTAGAILVNGVKVTPENLNPLQSGDNLVKRGKNSFAIVIQ